MFSIINSEIIRMEKEIDSSLLTFFKIELLKLKNNENYSLQRLEILRDNILREFHLNSKINIDKFERYMKHLFDFYRGIIVF